MKVKNADNRHIALCLKRYANDKALRLHMPGHKGGTFYNFNDQQVCDFLSEVYAYDITELSFSDNLASPNGVIKQAEDDIARILGAKKSFILTGGSSLGVLAMLYAVKNLGNKIIVSSKSHKSVFNALALLKIEPVFSDEFLSEFSLDEKACQNLAKLCDNGVIGALITSPDYFGRVAELKKIANILHDKNKLLLVDGAHGGHLKFTDEKLYAGNYADIWVDGSHKTLKTLTQGAVLNINSSEFTENIREGLDIFSTSSPNYLIMASVENGVKHFNEIPNAVFCAAREEVNYLKIHIKSPFTVEECSDYIKFIIKLNGYACSATAERVLQENGVYAEFVAGDYILFMLPPDFNRQQANAIIKAVNAIPVEKQNKRNYDIIYKKPILKKALTFIQARSQEGEYVLLKNAFGRICACEAGLFPPCQPIVVSGEVIDNEVIDLLSSKNVFGLKEGKIKVVKK